MYTPDSKSDGKWLKCNVQRFIYIYFLSVTVAKMLVVVVMWWWLYWWWFLLLLLLLF